MRLFAKGRTLAGSVFTLLFFLVASGNTQAQQKQQWGTVKGQIVFDGDKVPPRVALEVTKDKADCLAKKKELLSEEWVVDPKTKGVKWVYIWLILDSRKKADLVKAIPIHPSLKGKKLDNVVIDQPCCMFEPYCVALQSGQSITVKNSMSIAHNAKIDGSAEFNNQQVNQLIPVDGKINFGPFNAQRTEIPITCNIHGWMSGHIRVFSHPYFFVTRETGEFEIKDAPAGKYRLVIYHPGSGWVVGDKEPDAYGTQIEIKADTTTDLGKFKVLPPK